MSRQELRARGDALRASLGLDRPAGGDPVPGPIPVPVPGYDDFMAETAYGSIWDRPHLSKAERMLCTLGVLAFLPQPQALEQMVKAALDLELAPRSILECFMQSGLYAGYVTTATAGDVAQNVFAARGLTLDTEPPRDDSNDVLDQRGTELMHQLHGDRASKGYGAADNAMTAKLYTSAIRYGYGELWFRPGLDHRQRMLIAIASFTAIPLESQLRKFSQSALNIGLTADEVAEAVIQTAPYTGFPRALNGLAILSEVL